MLIATSCNKSVTDFVKGVKPPGGAITLAPNPFPADGIRISSGTLSATSSGVTAVAHVSTSNKTLKSSDISAKLAISRTRAVLQ